MLPVPSRPRSIADLDDLLLQRERVLAVVEREAVALLDKYGGSRRSQLVASAGDPSVLSEEAVIHNEQSFLVFSRRGFIKRMRADVFPVQARGGRGTACMRIASCFLFALARYVLARLSC